jgi:hypothetical protein
MSATPPTKDQRDANLDALKKATKDWADKEIKRLENETKFLRAVISGRGASENGTQNLYIVKDLAVGEIDEFLRHL